MKKRSRLLVHRETLRQLTRSNLDEAVAGYDPSHCSRCCKIQPPETECCVTTGSLWC